LVLAVLLETMVERHLLSGQVLLGVTLERQRVAELAEAEVVVELALLLLHMTQATAGATGLMAMILLVVILAESDKGQRHGSFMRLVAFYMVLAAEARSRMVLTATTVMVARLVEETDKQMTTYHLPERPTRVAAAAQGRTLDMVKLAVPGLSSFATSVQRKEVNKHD